MNELSFLCAAKLSDGKILEFWDVSWVILNITTYYLPSNFWKRFCRRILSVRTDGIAGSFWVVPNTTS